MVFLKLMIVSIVFWSFFHWVFLKALDNRCDNVANFFAWLASMTLAIFVVLMIIFLWEWVMLDEFFALPTLPNWMLDYEH